MMQCPRCSQDVPDGGRFCPACAAPLDAHAHATQTSLPQLTAPAAPLSSPPPGGGEVRFLPGSIILGRYRIVGLLGRGGMGEVYRADDLKLGQPVALKFLPEDFERDEGRLQRFLNEVRMALRITHPNVCRVHDIGEIPADAEGRSGQHFISMEFVDGEDLASLLRRIGRLPQERAVEIARQLCAGLAAAHEEGILHRDLKPANVMIDGRGRARITDFGLADLSGAIHGAEVRAGTPSYMSPEQLEGREVSTRSDVYALGLVLYEMFTGKPAYEAQSLADMKRLKQSTVPTSPTTWVRGLDPAIEGVVLRSLDSDPSRRPPSALAVAAALPGGDPLAAALAAGETPSPEMVAAAGDAGGVPPLRVALAALLIVVGLVGVALVRPMADVLGWIETPYSMSALRERSQLMLERLGFDAAPPSTAHGLIVDSEVLRWLREDTSSMRQRVAAEWPPVYAFWYRQSRTGLTPVDPTEDRTGAFDPPLTRPGMARVFVDSHARLVQLEAIPGGDDPEVSASPEALDTLWSGLFEEAGIDPRRFTPVEPSRSPPVYADTLAAWEGTLEALPDVPVEIEAAALRGKPVRFAVHGPWDEKLAGRDASDGGRAFQMVFFMTLLLSVLIGLTVLARRNLRQGRSDLTGAIRVGTYIAVTELISVLLLGGYLIDLESSVGRLLLRIAFVVFLASLVFLAYVALEPYVRRLWPTILISWTRLLSGRWRDPMIGRDLLIGGVAGIGTRFLWVGHGLLPPLLGLPEETLSASAAFHTLAPLQAVAEGISVFGQSVGEPMLFVVALVLLRLLLRNGLAAVAVVFLISLVPMFASSEHLILDLAVQATVMGLTLLVVLRVGLLAAVAMWLFYNLGQGVLGLDPSAWTGPRAVVNAIAILAVATYASVIALGGKTVLQDEI